jgi:hypothetical protein
MDVGTPPQRLAPDVVLQPDGGAEYLTFSTRLDKETKHFHPNESSTFEVGQEMPYLGLTGNLSSDAVTLNGIAARQELGRSPTGCADKVMAPYVRDRKKEGRASGDVRHGGFVSLSPSSRFMTSVLQGRDPLIGMFVRAEWEGGQIVQTRGRLPYDDTAGELTIG